MSHSCWRAPCRGACGRDTRSIDHGLRYGELKEKEQLGQCRSSADWVGAKGKYVWGRVSVASTFGQMAGGDAFFIEEELFHTCWRNVWDSV